jgi:alkyl hydroperoxide reductase subunit F
MAQLKSYLERATQPVEIIGVAGRQQASSDLQSLLKDITDSSALWSP